MENKHTPGPWRLNEYNHIIDNNNKEVIFYGIMNAMGRSGHGTPKKNTKLTAAAPELLEACKLILYRLEQQKIEGKYPDNIPSEIWTCELFLYNAIKKATE